MDSIRYDGNLQEVVDWLGADLAALNSDGLITINASADGVAYTYAKPGDTLTRVDDVVTVQAFAR